METFLTLLQDILESRNAIKVINNAVVRYDYSDIELNKQGLEKLRSNIDSLTPGLLIIYLFAIFESYIGWESWKNFRGEDAARLRAYRHIRHSYAHFPLANGRADKQKDDFDHVMADK